MQKKIHVYLVDDDHSFRFITKRLCQRIASIGQIDEFDDVYATLRTIMSNKKKTTLLPDLILLDLDFPALNGWEFLEGFGELQTFLPKKIPIYLVSSSILKADQQKAEEFPAVKGFITKPITEHQIRVIVEKMEAISGS